MLVIDEKWIKGEYADTKYVEYIDEKLMLSFKLCIERDGEGRQKVVPYDKTPIDSRLSRSDLSLVAIVAEALYKQIGEFTLELPKIRGEIKIDPSSHENIEGDIMASVAGALRKGDIALF